MSEHPDAVYDENALAPGTTNMAPSNAGSQGGGVGGGGAGGEVVWYMDNVVPGPVEAPEPAVVPPAPQDPFHVGGNPANPVAEGQIPEIQNFIDLEDADEPIMEQFFPDMVDGATATETSSSEGTVCTIRLQFFLEGHPRTTSTMRLDQWNSSSNSLWFHQSLHTCRVPQIACQEMRCYGKRH
jgi:hypothetical protein